MATISLGVGGGLSRAVRPSPYEPPGLGRLRKIALIGTAPTMHLAPFDDPSWEIWTHNSSARFLPRADRIFDLHPRWWWEKEKRWLPNYVKWLKQCPVPIYMQRRYPDIPQSIAYPKARVLAEFRRYFSTQTAWMIALALTEGVTHIGFFGIHYATKDERGEQRPGCEYWMGVAEGRGVQLVIPEGCPLLHEPKLLYGYENYKKGKQVKLSEPTALKKFDDSKLVTLDMGSTAERIPLKKLTKCDTVAWEHSGHTHRF